LLIYAQCVLMVILAIELMITHGKILYFVVKVVVRTDKILSKQAREYISCDKTSWVCKRLRSEVKVVVLIATIWHDFYLIPG
jgi:hypothetical protein